MELQRVHGRTGLRGESRTDWFKAIEWAAYLLAGAGAGWFVANVSGPILARLVLG